MYDGDRWADYRREGKVFIATHNVQIIEVNAISDVLIRVPDASSISALIQSEVMDYVNFSIYENSTIASVGTQIIPRNMNRSYSDEIDVLFSHTPTISELGTRFYDEFSLAWLGYFNDGTGVWELKNGNNYLIRAQNISNDEGYLNWRIAFRKITT